MNMNNEMNMNTEPDEIDNIIILTDESGSDVRFEFITLIEYNGSEYVVLLPADEDEDADEVVILRVEDVDDETESYVGVDDEDTLNAVFAIFKDRFKDEFNFEG